MTSARSAAPSAAPMGAATAGHGVGTAMAHQLLRRARLELDAAHQATDDTMRFLHAHMAAIRCASAVLALIAPGPRRRRRVLSVWEQLADADQRWQGWSATFAAGAPVRAAIDSGRITSLDPQVATAAVDAVAEFIDEVAGFARADRTPSAAPIAS